ncbi:MAG TPA: LacI family DNA-binding transcriptional regulator [Rhodothermales bacterium]|nr:LacI family DNA-binding transcriptional regulator [Rhodothermales bacterium]
MSNVTIHDVAERAGVSIGTVSAVINHKNTVSKATRRKVLQAVSELNYRPSAAARRRLKPSTEKSIGLVIKEVHNPYFADIIIGVQQAARAQGFNVLVVSSERDYKLEQQLVDLLVAKDVEGIIINPLFDEKADLSHLFEIKRRNIPLVLIENVRGIQASMVDVDNVAASKEAVKHLIDRGHKRIVHFAGPKYSMHSDERIEGVRRAFSAQRLIFDDHDIVYAGARLEDGYQAGLDFFRDRTEDMPTAVTCYNDLLALGLIRALRELGLRVPEDVSVIGYDDIDMASYASVPLTTVRVPKEQIGQQATDILIQHIEALDAGVIEKVCMQAELVVRESTRVLPAEEADEVPDLVATTSEE